MKLDAADLSLAAVIVFILQCHMADSCGDLIASHAGNKGNPFSQFISNLPIIPDFSIKLYSYQPKYVFQRCILVPWEKIFGTKATEQGFVFCDTCI